MISHHDIPIEIKTIANTLEKEGFEAFLVGGCVRDLLLNKKPKDWDITTDAHPEQILKLFPDSYCNNDYGTVGVKNESVVDETLKVVEVTPYRTESAYTDARRPDKVYFGVSLSEDLKRRDFTVNAIAYNISQQKIVDEHNGLKDLKQRRISTVGRADDRFNEDALRMLRAIRLATELGFAIDSETMSAIIKNRHKIQQISIERIATEWLRIINSDEPMVGMVYLEKVKLLEFIIPELLPSINCQQGGIHKYDVFEHLLRTLQASADKNFPLEVRLAALFHDIGKPATRRTGGKNKLYTFFGHEVVGAKMTKSILKRLKIQNDLSILVVKLVRWHMFFSDPDEVTLKAVRRTITRIGKDQIDNLLNLRVCDRIGTGRPKEQPFRFRKYKAMVDEALRDPLSVKMLNISGDKIMEITGEKPGKKIGYILHALMEEVLIDPSINTAETLEKTVLKLVNKDEETLKIMAEAGKNSLEEEENSILKQIARQHKVG